MILQIILFCCNLIILFLIIFFSTKKRKNKEPKIKMFICDIDGTLTDGHNYQLENGQEMKSFSCKDGAGFYILKQKFPDIKIIFITSEQQGINLRRFEKLHKLGVVDYFIDDACGEGKVKAVLRRYIQEFDFGDFKDTHEIENFVKNNTAFIGDDINDKELLERVKYKACPNDANYLIKKIKGIKIMKNKGGEGAVREFINYLMKKNLFESNEEKKK